MSTANDDSPCELDVSICIPVFNERLALRETVVEIDQAMKSLPYRYEIILIDDGSHDDCLATVADLPLRIIRHKRNLGGGIARVTGMRYARGRIIVQSDADGTYPCDQLGTMLARMDTAHLVIGARTHESATDWRFLRVLMKWGLRTFASLLLQRNIVDLNSGFRIYRRKLALRYAHLYPKGHSIMSTMTLAFISEGYIVEFVPIGYRVRKGPSSFRPGHDTFNYLRTIVSSIAYFYPVRIMLPIIIFMLGASALTLVVDVAKDKDVYNSVALFFATIFTFILSVIMGQLTRIARQILHMQSDHWPDEEVEEVGCIADPGDRSGGSSPICP